MQAMQGMMQNPEFVQMAERLGAQMMQDPAVSGMMAQMQNPTTAAAMKQKMEGAQLERRAAPGPPRLAAHARTRTQRRCRGPQS